MEFQRLKDKLGTRSLPSSEVEFRGAAARLLGEEGRGVATIIEMVTHTRLDCIVGSAVLDAPRRRRGDLARAPPLRLRRAAGRPAGDDQRARRSGAGVRSRDGDRAAPGTRLRRGRHARFRRFGTAIAKYWVCKRATPHAAEALECLGGNGYVEESPLPRLLRDAPLNGIWEGSGNVIALDVLRALSREPEGWRVRRGVRARARRRTRCWTRTSIALPIRHRPVVAHGARSRSWRWPSRRRCSCATRPRSSPTPSAPRGSAAAGASTARCRPAWTAPAIVARALEID